MRKSPVGFHWPGCDEVGEAGFLRLYVLAGNHDSGHSDGNRRGMLYGLHGTKLRNAAGGAHDDCVFLLSGMQLVLLRPLAADTAHKYGFFRPQN